MCEVEDQAQADSLVSQAVPYLHVAEPLACAGSDTELRARTLCPAVLKRGPITETIQSRCKALEKPRIAAHHMIWREILLQLLSLSGDEGDEHKWVVPSAVSTETHK